MENNQQLVKRLRQGYLQYVYPQRDRGPNQIVLKMTNACNLRCIYCYSNAGNHKRTKMISADMVVDFFDQYFDCFNNTNVNCTFHGGEPLLAVEVSEEIINRIKAKYYASRVFYSIQTNATLINDKNITFLKSNFKNVGISLDGVGEVQNLTRPTFDRASSFELLKRGIDVLHENKIQCGALIVATKYNQDSLLDTIKWCVQNGIYGVGIEMVFQGGRATTEMEFSPKVYYKCIEDILYWQIDYNLHSEKKFYLRDFQTVAEKIVCQTQGHMCAAIPCGAGKDEISIDFDGNVYVCDTFYGIPEYRMGNLYQDKLADICKSVVVEKMKGRRLEDTPICNQCKLNSICIIGCPIRNIIINDAEIITINNQRFLCEYYGALASTMYRLLTVDKLSPELFFNTDGRVLNYVSLDI